MHEFVAFTGRPPIGQFGGTINILTRRFASLFSHRPFSVYFFTRANTGLPVNHSQRFMGRPFMPGFSRQQDLGSVHRLLETAHLWFRRFVERERHFASKRLQFFAQPLNIEM